MFYPMQKVAVIFPGEIPQSVEPKVLKKRPFSAEYKKRVSLLCAEHKKWVSLYEERRSSLLDNDRNSGLKRFSTISQKIKKTLLLTTRECYNSG